MQELPLVGRDAEIAWLAGALDGLARGEGGVAVLTGPPGIGKTRLLDEAAARVSDEALLLRGRASEFERTFPFGVFVDALDDYLRSLARSPLAEIDPASHAELTLVFPGLRAHAAASEVGRPTADGRVRAYFALRSLLEVLAQGHPVVLLLDDLHWADRASVELLAHLVRRPPRQPVLIAAAFREHQVDPDLEAVVERGAAEGRIELRRIAPLSPAEAGELVGRSEQEAQRWHELSGGNPLLLLEMDRAGQGVGAPESGPAAAFAAVVGRELEPLSAAARALVESAAVVGDPFDLDLAIAAAGLEHGKALAALDELAGHRLVRRTEVPRRFAFRHPLVRHAVYDGLGPGNRLATHERCVAALSARDAPAVELAHHVEHAARPGDLAAVAVLEAAATEVAARAPASAVRWLGSAYRLLPRQADADERLRLVEPRAALHLAIGEVDEAHASLVEALALTRSEDRARQTRLATACAGVEQLLGRHAEAGERLERCLAQLPADAGEAVVEVLVALAMTHFYRRQVPEMCALARRAVEIAEQVRDPVLQARAHGALAFGAALAGDVPVAERHAHRAGALVDALADADLARQLDAIGLLAGAELYLERFGDAVRHGTRGLAVGRATGTSASAPLLVPTVGSSLWVTGRLDASVTLLDEAVESARAARNRQALAWGLFNLGFAQAKAGAFEAALETTDEALGIALGLGDSVLVSWAAACWAQARIHTGDAARALEVMYAHCGGPELPGLPGGWRTHYLDLAVACLLETGRIDEAERTADVAQQLAGAVPLPYTRAMAGAARARCRLARGDALGAAEDARTAVAYAEQADGRFDAALLRVLLGRALAAAGVTEEAVAVLGEAAARLDAMGAHRHRDRAEQVLGQLGHRPRRRTRSGSGTSGVDALTEREREIAELLAERCTNPEIADRLYLSPRTVETHVRNIFRKLDVTTRVDAGRVWRASRPSRLER
ncbi:AAA family ATPase [Nocardioides sp. R1-1]|uniref:helix-turn-helix transcriptional regulator n=1 Tax=Nocardioides sp. R1-1 TaxID=3383502 RepID=UPI0038CFEA78